MTLQQLIYFREVATTLNFTKAAQNQYVTQSALSYSILSLERELGVPLLVRQSGKKVDLTTFGRALLPMADSAISCMQNIENKMQMMKNPLTGIVNLAFSYMNCWRFIPQMLNAFKRENTSEDISINFQVNHRRRNFEDEVIQGDIDIAFSCLSEQDGLEIVPFVNQRLYVVMPQDHPLAGLECLTVENIKEEHFIGYHQGRNLDRWIHTMFCNHGLKPNMVDYVDEWSTQIPLIALGHGISIMPMVPSEAGVVRFIPLNDSMNSRPVYMMWATNRDLSPAVKFVRDYFLKYRKEFDSV